MAAGTARSRLSKIKGSVTYRFPYVRHLKYRIAHERLKRNWKSHYRGELSSLLNDSLGPPPAHWVREIPEDCLIEINNTCNLRCPMCSTHLAKREKKNMDLETYRRVLERVKEAGINTVALFTVGEPLVYPWLKEAVSIAKEQGIGVLITTNASLPDRLRSLYESHPESAQRFTFSIDSATPETYEEVRRGGRLEKVIESCEWILKVNKNSHMSRIALDIMCVISKDNIRELATFMRFFSKYTFPECIHFMLVNSLSPDQTFFNEHGLAVRDLYRLNVPCDISVFHRIYINNEGQVTLCCRDYDAQLVVGSVLEQPLLEIWQSEAAQKIRAQHLGQEELTIAQCKQCYYPKPGVNEMVNRFVHTLPYSADRFDDEEWGERLMDFLKDLNAVLGEPGNREAKAEKVLNHL